MFCPAAWRVNNNIFVDKTGAWPESLSTCQIEEGAQGYQWYLIPFAALQAQWHCYRSAIRGHTWVYLNIFQVTICLW